MGGVKIRVPRDVLELAISWSFSVTIAWSAQIIQTDRIHVACRGGSRGFRWGRGTKGTARLERPKLEA